MNTKKPLMGLILTTVSDNLQLDKPTDCWSLFESNIEKTFVNIKTELESFLDKEISKLQIEQIERRELLFANKNKLQSPVWRQHIMKMHNEKFVLFQECVKQAQWKSIFSHEQQLTRYFVKKDTEILILKTTDAFKTIFERTNSAKYKNVDIWFEMFANSLSEAFQEYPYICWERVVLQLKEEKPLDFPAFNDILRRMDKLNVPVKEVDFLKELKLID